MAALNTASQQQQQQRGAKGRVVCLLSESSGDEDADEDADVDLGDGDDPHAVHAARHTGAHAAHATHAVHALDAAHAAHAAHAADSLPDCIPDTEDVDMAVTPDSGSEGGEGAALPDGAEAFFGDVVLDTEAPEEMVADGYEYGEYEDMEYDDAAQDDEAGPEAVLGAGHKPAEDGADDWIVQEEAALEHVGAAPQYVRPFST